MPSQATFPDLLRTLKAEGLMSPPDLARLRDNYTYFQSQRAYIEQTFSSQWVASLDSQLYARPSLRQLKADLGDNPGFEFAYIEQVC